MTGRPDIEAPQQLTFDLSVRPATGRDDFLVTDANRAAVSLIDSWPDWRVPVQVIVGPAGSGKSHLSDVWRDVSGANATTVEALDKNSVPELLSAPGLIVDGVPDRNLPEQTLFHLINHGREHGRHILLTSQVFPARWQINLPDLASRMRAAGVCELGPPDDVLLRAVMVKQFADRQMQVDDKVIGYIVNRMERSMSAARAIVAAIDERALMKKARVTRTLAAEVLASLSGLR